MKWFASRAPEPPGPAAEIDQKLIDSIGCLYYQHRFALTVGSLAEDDSPAWDDAFQSQLGAGGLMGFMPRLPAVLPSLIGMMRDPEARINDLVAQVVQDPTLVTRVLSLANSPYYRRSRRQLEDLETAVVYLGEDGLRMLVTATVMQPILTIPAGSASPALRTFTEEVYGQALATADLARELASSLGMHPSMQHLCGLLHATGEVAILAWALRNPEWCRPEELPRMLATLCRRYARRTTATAAAEWELGEEIEHNLRCAWDPVAIDTPESRFTRQVLVAAQIRWLFAAEHLPRDDAGAHLAELDLPDQVLTHIS